MATSVLIACDHSTNPNLQPLPDHKDHDRHAIRRSSAGRRKPKARGSDSSSTGPKKKQPQRGMGVEKLERLRLQDRWKKITEIDTSTQAPFTGPAVSATFSDPALINAASAASFQFSKMGGFGAPKMSHGKMGLNQSGLGFQGQMGSLGGFVSDQFPAELFGVGSSGNGAFHVKSVTEISKELSSTPNPVAVAFPSTERCYSCQKKKRLVHNSENMGCSGVMRSLQISSGADHCGFLGLNPGDNPNFKNQENQGHPALFSPVGYAAIRPSHPAVELVAVHTKGSCSNNQEEEGHVLMEYEFFPSSFGRKDSSNDEFVMMKVSETASSGNYMGVGHIQQALFPCLDMAAPNSSSSIDLSLKLSY